MPHLHIVKNFVPITEDLCNLTISPHVIKITKENDRTSKTRNGLRPGRWPPFEELREKATNWKEYAVLRKNALRKADNRKRKYRSASISPYDFDVYLPQHFAHSLPISPCFSVICFDSQEDVISIAELHRKSEGRSLIVAIFDHGIINFIETSGAPVDLNHYLEK
uniref:POPLD domain-containing protein n=1 Tax=Heterorhabditis bacteriophora TaxID=37862 RepID=A0A1I7XR42_HETBA